MQGFIEEDIEYLSLFIDEKATLYKVGEFDRFR